MMHPGNPLHLPGELNAGSVSRGGSFEVFRSTELGEYLLFDPPLVCSSSYPASAVRISLQIDVILLVPVSVSEVVSHQRINLPAKPYKPHPPGQLTTFISGLLCEEFSSFYCLFRGARLGISPARYERIALSTISRVSTGSSTIICKPIPQR